MSRDGLVNFRDVRDFNEIQREQYFKQRFEYIYESLGRTCADFPNCEHPACVDSHTAWAIAELALYSTGARRSEEETQASARYLEVQRKFGLDESRSREGRENKGDRTW